MKIKKITFKTHLATGDGEERSDPARSEQSRESMVLSYFSFLLPTDEKMSLFITMWSRLLAWAPVLSFQSCVVLLFSFLFHSFVGFPLACVHRDRPHLIRPGLNLFSVYIPVLVPFAFEYFVTSSTFHFFVVVCYHLPQTIIVYFAFLFRFFDVICVQSFLASFFLFSTTIRSFRSSCAPGMELGMCFLGHRWLAFLHISFKI